MNVCALTGIAVADSEVRLIEGGRELLFFDIYVDGSTRADCPRMRCTYLRSHHRPREVKAGQRLEIVGAIRYRMDVGLFLGAYKLSIMA